MGNLIKVSLNIFNGKLTETKIHAYIHAYILTRDCGILRSEKIYDMQSLWPNTCKIGKFLQNDNKDDKDDN